MKKTMSKVHIDEIRKIIKKHYFCKEINIKSICKVKNEHGINSRNYIVELIMKDGIKKYILKIISDSDDNFFKKIKIHNMLFNQNIKVPEIIKTRDDHLFIEDKNQIYLLLKYYSGTQFKKRKSQIFSSAKNLALINKKLEEIDIKLDRNSNYDNLKDEEIKKIKKMSNLNNEFENNIFNLCDILPELYAKINNKLNGINKKQLVYLDYHPKNVLFDDEEVLVIFDIDSIISSFEIQAFSFGLDRFCSNKNEEKTFIKGYTKINSNIKSDISLIPYFIQKEALHRINYIIRNYYFNNNNRWVFELDKHIKKIRINSCNKLLT